MLGSALHSDHFPFSHVQNLLSFVRFITSFLPRIALQILYVAFIRSRREFASVVWNNFIRIPADSSKFENAQEKFGNTRPS
jgi:hypothetical protein